MNPRTARWRLIVAAVALIVSAGWYWRPIARSVLLPVPVTRNEMGYVNGEGRRAFPGRWSTVGEFNPSGVAPVHKNGSLQWIDRSGRVATTPPPTDSGASENSGKILFDTQEIPSPYVLRPENSPPAGPPGPCGELDRDGRVIVAPQWDAGAHTEIGLARVLQNGLWGYMDRSGTWVIPPQWTFARDFDPEGLACVEREYRWGVIDVTGNVVIPVVYQFATDFDQSGLACVRKEDRCGFIDRTGHVIVPLEWEMATPFAGGPMAQVMRDGRWGGIDRRGRLIVECQWNQFQQLHDHGQLYLLFRENVFTRSDWRETLDRWTSGYFKHLVFPAGRKHLYDSQGRLVWSSTWFFASWAPWIMITAACVMLFELTQWTRSRQRRVPLAVAVERQCAAFSMASWEISLADSKRPATGESRPSPDGIQRQSPRKPASHRPNLEGPPDRGSVPTTDD